MAKEKLATGAAAAQSKLEEVKNNYQQNESGLGGPIQYEYFRVNNRNLRSDKVLAEGGFGFVYQVTDESTGEQFALKKININSKETFDLIKNEIDTWKKVSKSDEVNIVRFVDAS
tara:strand:+ start:120 stop:464 length:345 start_codon:yes stop_codon:yes gene_type:complete